MDPNSAHIDPRLSPGDVSAGLAGPSAHGVRPGGPNVAGGSTTEARASAAAAWPGAPKGCPRGSVCFYFDGNGGNLCGAFSSNKPFLGRCANIGPSGTIFNNGVDCDGCEDVALHYGRNYVGAWYCLPQGGYLLHIDRDRFDRGYGEVGFGHPLAYNTGTGYVGGVASVDWTSC